MPSKLKQRRLRRLKADLAWWREEAEDCRSRLLELPHWEGDAIFLDLLARDVPFFSLKLRYDKDDQLVEAVLNGEKIR